MTSEEKIFDNLQSSMDFVKRGKLLVIRLVNAIELKILFDGKNDFVNKFSTLIDNLCKKVKIDLILKMQNQTEFFIIASDDLNIEEELVYPIYFQTQLFIDEEYPENYFKCAMGSASFSQQNYHKSEKLYSLISYGISNLKNRYYYNHEDNPINVDKVRANNSQLCLFKKALIDNSAKFMYQPVIDRESATIEYYECLLRIRDENGGYVSIGPMIENAEKQGLIGLIDSTVVEMAIDELSKDKKISLSVNISNLGVLNHRLLNQIEELLKKHQDIAKRLIIEITETSFNNEFATTKKFIETLHIYGCRFALDDFGSGFTSFKQLLNLPIDIIKIDGSYIRDILDNEHSKFFVEALINLAEGLGIKTVAEFVENGEIAKYLIDIKIDGMQGNFFSPATKYRLQ